MNSHIFIFDEKNKSYRCDHNDTYNFETNHISSFYLFPKQLLIIINKNKLKNNDKTLLGNYTNTSINSAIGILNDKFIDNTKIYFNFWFDMHVNNIFTKKYNTPNQYQVHTHHSSHYKTKMKKITKKQPVIIEDISAVIHYIKNLIIDKYDKENIVDLHIKNTWFDVGYKNNNDIIIQFKFAFNLFANFKKTETQINLNDIIEIINISLKDTIKYKNS